MSTSTLHPLATAYLQQVRREGRDLPGDRLAELLIDLEEHLSAAIPADASDEDAREVLDRLGDPREIIAAERPESIGPAERRGTREWAAVFLLLFGFIAAGVGWVVGVVLLWRSRAWTTTRQAHRHACPSGWPACDGAAPVAGSRATTQGNLHPPR